MVIERLRKGDPLCHRVCEIELILHFLCPTLSLLNFIILLILKVLRTTFLINELVDNECLVFLLLASLALQVHLLNPLSSIIDFLLNGHAFVEGSLALCSSTASHSFFDSLPALLERLVTAVKHSLIVLSASLDFHKLLMFSLILKLFFLEALHVLLLFLVLDSFSLQNVLFELGLVIILYPFSLKVELFVNTISEVLHMIFHLLLLLHFQLSRPLHPLLKAF